MDNLGDVSQKIHGVLVPYAGSIVARSIVSVSAQQVGIGLSNPPRERLGELVDQIRSGMRAFVPDQEKVDKAAEELRSILGLEDVASVPAQVVVERPTLGDLSRQVISDSSKRKIEIHAEYDIVTARGTCRGVCEEIGFSTLDQVKIATAVSELARNIVQYAGSGYVTLTRLTMPRPGIEIEAVDFGNGIPNEKLVFSGDYESKTGMGVGLTGTKRLMDEFHLETGASGTRVVGRKYLA